MYDKLFYQDPVPSKLDGLDRFVIWSGVLVYVPNEFYYLTFILCKMMIHEMKNFQNPDESPFLRSCPLLKNLDNLKSCIK